MIFGCSNRANAEKGISLHRILFWNDERPEAKRRRKIWVNFVATKRAKWTPSKFSAICSKHFNAEDYEKYLVEVPGTRDYTPRLKKEEICIAVYPTKFARSSLEDEVISLHVISVRYVNHFCVLFVFKYDKHIDVFLDIICKCAFTLMVYRQKRNSS